MTVSRDVASEIRVLFFGDHLPVGTVASQLHVHEDVVKRVIGLLEPRPPPPPRARKVDPVKDFILETLERYPRLRATRLCDMVKARGYTGAIRLPAPDAAHRPAGAGRLGARRRGRRPRRPARPLALRHLAAVVAGDVGRVRARPVGLVALALAVAPARISAARPASGSSTTRRSSSSSATAPRRDSTRSCSIWRASMRCASSSARRGRPTRTATSSA